METSAKHLLVVLFTVAAFGQDAPVNSPDINASDSAPAIHLLAAVEAPMALVAGGEIAPPAALTATAARVTVGAAMATQAPSKPVVSERERKTWYILLGADHSAAFFDAWSTRTVLSNGGRELDPIVRPFAHSSALYPALQVAPLGADYFGAKLMQSRNRTLRKLWWVPQAVAAAGSMFCGATNLAGTRSFSVPSN
jgi:hypothetical protein